MSEIEKGDAVEHEVVVVGGGIAGLSAAYRIGAQLGGMKVPVLEAAARPGGTATTDHVAGFTVDRGPNAFLTSGQSTWALAHELGIEASLRCAEPTARRRFIYLNEGLAALPNSPWGFIRSELLTPAGVARAAAEPFVPRRSSDKDEAVWDFFARRFGPEFAERFATVGVLGVSAGDARRASTAALFPKLWALEAEHGSLARGMLRTQLAALRSRAQRQLTGEVSAPAAPPRAMASFGSAGMQKLCDALTDSKYVSFFPETPVASVEPAELGGAPGYLLHSAHGQTITCRQVVLAVPAYRAAELLKASAPALAAECRGVPFAGVGVVTLAFDESDVASAEVPTGFGFLVPRGAGLRMLGCQWTEAFFPEQAPNGQRVFRMIYGGAFDAHFAGLAQDEATRIARYELDRMLGVSGEPSLEHVTMWRRGIPQYELGHQARLGRIEEALTELPGLHVAGNSYYGVAFNECTRDAFRVASAVEAAYSRATRRRSVGVRAAG